MTETLHTLLPITNPTWGFFTMLCVILVAPRLFERLRVPSIAGMIIAGILVGPFGLGLLERDATIDMFGKVGLYYIMFLASLEMNLQQVMRNKRQALLFGLLSFLMPIALGFAANYWLLGYGVAAAILMAAMYASHTLLTYPIVMKYGLGRLRAVNLAVGGTIVADTLTLLVLAVVGGAFRGETGALFWTLMALKILGICVVIVGGLPWVCRWFFRRSREGVVQYIFVLALVFLSAGLMEFVGMEGILGAFLAGIVLGRVIPASSPLMAHIEFVGNALFIPYFLIGVGMMIDLGGLFGTGRGLFVAAVMFLTATLAKGLAAFAGRRAFRLTRSESSLIFGLTSARAAATLAIVLVGMEIRLPDGTPLFDEQVLGGTMLLILLSCLVSSMVTERAARHIVLHEDAINTQNEEDDRILVAIEDEEKMTSLTDAALALRAPRSLGQLNAVNVVTEDNDVLLRRGQRAVEAAAKIAAAAGVQMHTQCRFSVNPVTGLSHSVRECAATDVLVGLHDKEKVSDSFLGRFTQDLLGAVSQQIIIYRPVVAIGVVRRLHVVVPRKAEFDPGFHQWAGRVAALAHNLSCSVTIYGGRETMAELELFWSGSQMGVQGEYVDFSDFSDMQPVVERMRHDHMVIIIAARPGMPSYQSWQRRIPEQVERYFASRSIMLIHPARYGAGLTASVLKTGGA